MADQNNDFVTKLLKEQYKQLLNTKKELENSLQYYEGLVEDFKKKITQAASDIANIEASGIDLSEPEEVNTGGPTTETEVSPNLDGSSSESSSEAPAATENTETAENTETPAATENTEATESSETPAATENSQTTE